MSSRLKDIIELKSKLKSNGRDFVKKIFDDGTFIETSTFMKKNDEKFDVTKNSTEGVTIGKGLIDGRLIFIVAQDKNLSFSKISKVHTEKICKLQREAMKVGAPIIYIFNSDGIDINEGIESLYGLSNVIKNTIDASGLIPQISIVMGDCGGTMAMLPMSTDFTIMVNKKAKLYGTAKDAVKCDSVPDDFGEASFHKDTGVCDLIAENEDDAINIVKELVSYLPQNNMEKTEIKNTSDDINRVENALNEMSENKINIKEIIKLVVDDKKYFEVSKDFADNMMTCFARIGGMSVGILANINESHCGRINVEAMDKATRFIRLCDSYNIPIVSFVDTEGYGKCLRNEKSGVIKKGAILTSMYASATTPMISIIVDRAIGSGFVMMGQKSMGVDNVYAWPNAKISNFSKEVGAVITYKKDMIGAKDVDNAKKQYEEKYADEFMTPYIAAGRGYIDDIIEPATTRQIIISSLEALDTKVARKINKKHSNI